MSLDAVQERIGHRFRSSALLEQALTHRSFAHESAEGVSHYERLEFLGDALLGLVTSEWLVRDDPDADEGLLSRRRQTVVRTLALAGAARRLQLDQAMRLGKGEESSGGRARPSLLADVFEAVLGAIYLDAGILAVRRFVRRELAPDLKATRSLEQAAGDYKTRLQEEAQARLRRTPTYRIVATTGPDHARQFEVEAVLDGEVVGRGRGSSRKQAEQQAARRALARLRDESESR